jgi:hypothetical protein
MDSKISELTSGVLGAADYLPIARSGSNYRLNFKDSVESTYQSGASVFVGAEAFEFRVGNETTAVGSRVLQNLNGGNFNTALGESAGQNVESGSDNIFIGNDAGLTIVDGSDNIAIGSQTTFSGPSDTNSIVIGNDAIGAGSNTVRIGNIDIENTYLRGLVHVSDLEVLGNINFDTLATNFIAMGSSSPQGIIPSSPGSLYLRTDGSVNTTLYTKETGIAELGWRPVLTRPPQALMFAVSDETTALTTGAAKVTFRMPYAMTVTGLRANVNTAPTGTGIMVDINENGTSIMTTTKLYIDATEKTSLTAANTAVITDSSLADDAEMTIDIDLVGTGIAGAGLKVALLGYRND